MSAAELATAADCYQRLQEVAERLEQLYGAGRLRMDSDSTNTAWPDVDAAVQAALAALDVAVQAMAWMQTTGGAR